MAINNNTLSVDVFNTVMTVLVANKPKVTNTTTHKTKTASIAVAYNDKKVDAPQIVLYAPQISESGYRFGESQGKKSITVVVECYYDNALGANQLSDSVTATIKEAIDNQTITGVDLIAIEKEVAITDPSQIKFQLTSVAFIFDRE